MVSGYTVIIDENTDTDGELMAGLTAEVEGVLQKEGTVLVSILEVKEAAGEEVHE